MSRGPNFSPGVGMQSCLDALESAERFGLTMKDLSRACRRAQTATHNSMKRLEAQGRVEYREEFNENSRTVRRWYLAEYAPRVGQSRAVRGGIVAAPRSGTLADPWGVCCAARVIDSAECRPWAVAAAQCVWARHG